MWSEWRKDYFTLRYVLRRTWWLWGVGIIVIIILLLN